MLFSLPWAEHPVTLRYSLRRLWCQHFGIRTERVGFAEAHARGSKGEVGDGFAATISTIAPSRASR